MPTVDQIRHSIEARIAELNTEITSLQAARSALQSKNATSAPAPAPAPAPAADSAQPTANGKAPARPSAPRKPRTPRAPRTPAGPPQVLLAGKLEAMLRGAEDGLSASAIAKQSGARVSQVRDLAEELERAGKARRIGNGRASVWRLITDEEWITNRAAELERQSALAPTAPRKRRWRTPEDPS